MSSRYYSGRSAPRSYERRFNKNEHRQFQHGRDTHADGSRKQDKMASVKEHAMVKIEKYLKSSAADLGRSPRLMKNQEKTLPKPRGTLSKGLKMLATTEEPRGMNETMNTRPSLMEHSHKEHQHDFRKTSAAPAFKNVFKEVQKNKPHLSDRAGPSPTPALTDRYRLDSSERATKQPTGRRSSEYEYQCLTDERNEENDYKQKHLARRKYLEDEQDDDTGYYQSVSKWKETDYMASTYRRSPDMDANSHECDRMQSHGYEKSSYKSKEVYGYKSPEYERSPDNIQAEYKDGQTLWQQSQISPRDFPEPPQYASSYHLMSKNLPATSNDHMLQEDTSLQNKADIQSYSWVGEFLDDEEEVITKPMPKPMNIRCHTLDDETFPLDYKSRHGSKGNEAISSSYRTKRKYLESNTALLRKSELQESNIYHEDAEKRIIPTPQTSHELPKVESNKIKINLSFKGIDKLKSEGAGQSRTLLQQRNIKVQHAHGILKRHSEQKNPEEILEMAVSKKKRSRWDSTEGKAGSQHHCREESSKPIISSFPRYEEDARTTSEFMYPVKGRESNRSFSALYADKDSNISDSQRKRYEGQRSNNNDSKSDLVRSGSNYDSLPRYREEIYPRREFQDKSADDAMHQEKFKEFKQDPALSKIITPKLVELHRLIKDRFNDHQSRRGSLHMERSKKLETQFDSRRFIASSAEFGDKKVADMYGDMEMDDDNSETESRVWQGKNSNTPQPRIVQQTSNRQVIADFQGAWKAATNSSIKLQNNQETTDQRNYQVYSTTDSTLRKLFRESKDLTPTEKFQPVSSDTFGALPLKPFADKREVQYSTQNKQARIFSGKSVGEMTQKSKFPHHLQTHGDSQQVKVDERRVFSTREDDGQVSLQRSKEKIASRDMQLFEKDFVDWFSRNILPTPMFSFYVTNSFSKMSSVKLASMPQTFLRSITNQDRLALQCIPKDPQMKRKLMSFLDEYKSFQQGTSKPQQETGDKPALQTKIPAVNQSARNKNSVFPVMISRNTAADKRSSVSLGKVDSSGAINATATKSKPPMEDLVITCSNIATTNNENVSQGSGRIVVPVSQSLKMTNPAHSARQEVLTKMSAGSTLQKSRTLNNSNSMLSKKVGNPRWNAEVEQFIDRTQSVHSRPAFVEYLEKVGMDRSGSERSDSSYSSRSGSYDKELSYGKRETRSSGRRSPRRRSHSQTSNRRRQSNRSPIRRSSERKPPASSSESRRDTRSPKRDNRNTTSASTAANTDRKGNQPSNHNMKSASERSSNSSHDHHTSTATEKLFGVTTKVLFNEDKIKFKKTDIAAFRQNVFLRFKNFLKNWASKTFNFSYDLESYEAQKLFAFIDETTERFSVYNKGLQAGSRNQSLYMLKKFFMNEKQEHLKQEVLKRGANWSSISLDAFQQFQKDVFAACEKDLIKKDSFNNQSSKKVSQITEKYEQLYPQFLGDAEFIIKLWVWKNRADKFESTSWKELEVELLTAWDKEVTEGNISGWFDKVFQSPPFTASARRCVAIFSVCQSKLNKSTLDTINDASSWWTSGYYKCRYAQLEDKNFDKQAETKSERMEKSSTSEPDEKKQTSEELVVLDEDTCDDVTADVMDVNVTQEDVVNEYAEDDTGAPTILLF